LIPFKREFKRNPAISTDMNNLYIIDAVNFLFRSYYGIGPMTNTAGQSSSALYGFIRSIQKLIKIVHPGHIVCVFDGPDNKKSRQDVYAEYKSHRKEAPQDLFPQIEWAHEYCTLAGIPKLCVEGVEADDVMATAALWAEKQGAKVYLCTSDKDLAQLVNKHIFLMHPHKDYMLVDEAKVLEIFGVRPDQILDYLAITGDASDNIPGLPGFGPKTAASLLQEFGTLKNILDHPEKVKGEKKQEVLREHKKTALLSQALARLDTNIKIPHDPDFYALKKPHHKDLINFYHKMKFNSLLRELDESKEETPKSDTDAKSIHYHIINTKEDLEKLLDRLAQEKEVGIDTETTSIHPMLADLVGIGFATQAKESWYVPCNGNIEKTDVIRSLKEFFTSTKCAFFGHNLKYDYHILANLEIPLKHICFDTILAAYLLEPHIRKHNLDDLTLEKFKHVKIPIVSLIGKGKEEISMQDAPIDKVGEYCCEDIDYTTRLKNLFSKELKASNLESILTDIELPLLTILAKMERVGIYLDTDRLKEIGKTLTHEIDQIKKKIFKEVGSEFNLNSPKQLSHVLFEQLGLQKPTREKTAFSTGAEVLEDLAFENPIAGDILNHRSLEKLRTTYAESLPLSVNPKTERIHCTFNQSVAATGRLSSQDPNLQNIPTRTKEGNSIRSCFKPQKRGWSFVGGDYSQIELRLLAHFSEDPELIKAFKEKEDIHEHTASRIFNLPITMITPEMRSAAKTVNFGIIYGQGPFGLSKQLHISMKEAQEFIKTYFERYPKIQAYLESCKESARKLGYSTTLTGRQRPIPELKNKNPSIRQAAERLAVNTPLQGTAADLIKLAMIAIDEEIRKKKLEGKMILQIHDELIFEVPDDEISTFKDLVKAKMEHVFKLKVPILVHIAVGKNWAEC
jgi:DNA polymerase I